MTQDPQDPLSAVTTAQEIIQLKNWLCDGSIHLEGWTVEHTVQPADTIDIPPLSEHMLVCGLAPSSSRQFCQFAGQEYDGVSYDNHFFIVPANVPARLAWDGEDEAVVFGIRPEALQQTAEQIGYVAPHTVELNPIIFSQDEQITLLTRCIAHEIRTGGEGGQLYSESLKNCFNVHLLRRYCNSEMRPRNYSGGLPHYRLREVLAYINSNLAHGNISIDAMARVAGLSSYYFTRQFKQSTGLAPHQYVTQQRIDRAKRLLKQRDLSIAQVGIECGFPNQSHFSRVFRQVVGFTPSRYRKEL